MTAEKTMFVRHVHTDEIREITAEQREVLDKNYWVRITGDDVRATPPDTAPAVDAGDAEQAATGDEPPAGNAPAVPKTAPKARAPKE
jgi:lysozyme family protein